MSEVVEKTKVSLGIKDYRIIKEARIEVEGITFIYGQNCGGKCLKIGTRVATDRGYLKIEDVCGNVEEGFNECNFNGRVLGPNGYQNIVKTYFKKNEDILSVELDNGKVISGTKEHPIQVLYGDKVILKQLGELNINDLVLVSNKVVYGCGDEYPVDQYYCLGMWLGNGWVSSIKLSSGGSLRFGYKSISRACVEVFKNVLALNGGIVSNKSGVKTSVGDDRKVVYSIRYTQFNDRNGVGHKYDNLIVKSILGVCYSYNKFVPECVFRASVKARVAFIKGIFDSVGCVNKRTKKFFVEVRSRLLRNGVAEVLESLGFVAEVGERFKRGKLVYGVWVQKERNVDYSVLNLYQSVKEWKVDVADVEGKKSVGDTVMSYANNQCVGIRGIKSGGLADVYDLVLDGDHLFYANGVVNHNSTCLEALRTVLDNVPAKENFRHSTGGFVVAIKADNKKLVYAKDGEVTKLKYNDEVVRTKLGRGPLHQLEPRFPLRRIDYISDHYYPNIAFQGEVPVLGNISVVDLFSSLFSNVAKVADRVTRARNDVVNVTEEKSTLDARVTYMQENVAKGQKDLESIVAMYPNLNESYDYLKELSERKKAIDKLNTDIVNGRRLYNDAECRRLTDLYDSAEGMFDDLAYVEGVNEYTNLLAKVEGDNKRCLDEFNSLVEVTVEDVALLKDYAYVCDLENDLDELKKDYSRYDIDFGIVGAVCEEIKIKDLLERDKADLELIEKEYENIEEKLKKIGCPVMAKGLCPERL